MDEQLFQHDWDLSQQISGLARKYLEEGISIDETMTKVLNSEEYQDWSSKTRTFGIESDKRIYYEDLFGSIQTEKYAELIQSYSNQYFSEEEIVVPMDSVQYDHIFEQLGMKVTVEKLGFEIARLSKMVRTSSPILYQPFLSLFTGTAMFGLEEDQVNCILAKEEEVSQFVEEFFQTYKMDI